MTAYNHSRTFGDERRDTLSLLPQLDAVAVSKGPIPSTYSSLTSQANRQEHIHEASKAVSGSNVDEVGLGMDGKQSKVVGLSVIHALANIVYRLQGSRH